MSNNIVAKPGERAVNLQQRMNSTMVWVTFDKVGFHRYPDAPDEVAYLRDRHRHVFKFRVAISVFHDDREIEFHMMKNWLLSLYEDGATSLRALEVDHKSCEMLAQDLMDQILKKYDCLKRRVVVDVSEDGECGASLFSEPHQVIPLSEQWLKEQYLNLATANAAEEASKATKPAAARKR